jgi:hypothetical protein
MGRVRPKKKAEPNTRVGTPQSELVRRPFVAFGLSTFSGH